jgi:SMC interacting uncharacterized protein involved in chromosome segregation
MRSEKGYLVQQLINIGLGENLMESIRERLSVLKWLLDKKEIDIKDIKEMNVGELLRCIDKICAFEYI